jgi:pilus assembly protein CpaE
MKIIAIAKERAVIDAIEEAAGAIEGASLVLIEGSLTEGMEEARGWQRANVVFVEMQLKDDEDRASFTQLCRDAIGEVVVTAADGGIEDVRWLMRNDVADFLPQPLNAAELRSSIESAGRKSRVQEDVGGDNAVVLAVAGACKGLGAATVACQTAVRIQEVADKGASICLVDLDFQFGKISTHLDVEGRVDITEIGEDPGRLDESFMQSLAVKHASGFDVLAPVERLVLWEQVTPEAVLRLMELVAHVYDYVIVNLPPYWASWTPEIVRGLDAMALVFQVNVESIRHTRLLIDTIFENGGGSVPMYLYANRFKKKFLWFGVNMKDVEKALGREISFYIPDNPAVVMDAINRGAPLKEVKAGSDVEKSISDATDELLKAVARSRGAAAA